MALLASGSDPTAVHRFMCGIDSWLHAYAEHRLSVETFFPSVGRFHQSTSGTVLESPKSEMSLVLPSVVSLARRCLRSPALRRWRPSSLASGVSGSRLVRYCKRQRTRRLSRFSSVSDTVLSHTGPVNHTYTIMPTRQKIFSSRSTSRII